LFVASGYPDTYREVSGAFFQNNLPFRSPAASYYPLAFRLSQLAKIKEKRAGRKM